MTDIKNDEEYDDEKNNGFCKTKADEEVTGISPVVAGGVLLKMRGLCQPRPRVRIHTTRTKHSQGFKIAVNFCQASHN